MKKRKAAKKEKQTKNPYPKKILSFLKRKEGEGYRRKEISKALNVKKATYFLFDEALKSLTDSGKVFRQKGGRYSLLKSRETVVGTLQMTRRGFGFVITESLEEDVYISGKNLETAFNGDEVKVELYNDSRGRSREGRIVKVVNRNITTFVGTFQKSAYYSFVNPDNNRVSQDFLVPAEHDGGAKNGQKVVIELLGWDPKRPNPEAKIVEILGYPDEPGVDVSSIVKGHGLPLVFSNAIEKEAAKMKLRITKQELSNRLDLRDKLIFTVDPHDAKDFDDAISLEELENGNQLLGVHIADVSFFVEEGSRLDREALSRATSIYLVDRVIPMLPEHLSNKLCSLQPNVDRMAFSCFMELDAKCDVVDYDVRTSVINSKRRFTYEEVQEIFDDKKSKDEYAEILGKMHALSRKLRDLRSRNGSIDFSTAEVKFVLNEKGEPIDIVPQTSDHSHQMIEEFMLMANQTVTKVVHRRRKDGRKAKPLPFVYRNHETPSPEKLQNFRTFLNALGYKVNIPNDISPAEFQKILNQFEGKSDESLIKVVALRTMMKAMYGTRNTGHFGLAFDNYAHFTSPIRRYPDLAVHRLIKEYARGPIAPARRSTIDKKLTKICQISSQRERAAMEAERDSIRLKQVEWLMKHKDQEFEGIVSGVTSFGVFVETQPYLIEGLIRMDELSDDYYVFNEKTYTMVGRDKGRKIRLGDPMRVKVAHIDRETNEIDFRMVD
ncbi:MAG: ribonuclease R [Calditrichia bacterium]